MLPIIVISKFVLCDQSERKFVAKLKFAKPLFVDYGKLIKA